MDNHNGEFCRTVWHPRFVDGDLNTNFIEKEYPDGFRASSLAITRSLRLQLSDDIYMAVEQQDFSVSDGKGGPGAFDPLEPMVCTIGTRTFDIRSILDEELENDNSSGDMIVVRGKTIYTGWMS